MKNRSTMKIVSFEYWLGFTVYNSEVFYVIRWNLMVNCLIFSASLGKSNYLKFDSLWNTFFYSFSLELVFFGENG